MSMPSSQTANVASISGGAYPALPPTARAQRQTPARYAPPLAGRYRSNCRHGLSLLEVILAIAILGLSIAAMSGLVHSGTRAAGQTRDLTRAQILCEGKVSEVVAGVIPPEPVDAAPFELEPDWTYSVFVTPLTQEGLLAVEVTVEQVVESGSPTTFTLTRWMIDPLLEQAQASATQPAGGSTTGATGGGSMGL